MPYCSNCGLFYPDGQPHNCRTGPYYAQPGLDESDRIVVHSIDQKTAGAITQLNDSIARLEDLLQRLIWAKNKLISIEQKIDTLQASIDLLNEKIP